MGLPTFAVVRFMGALLGLLSWCCLFVVFCCYMWSVGSCFACVCWFGFVAWGLGCELVAYLFGLLTLFCFGLLLGLCSCL